jgi:hypothetical protein
MFGNFSSCPEATGSYQRSNHCLIANDDLGVIFQLALKSASSHLELFSSGLGCVRLHGCWVFVTLG